MHAASGSHPNAMPLGTADTHGALLCSHRGGMQGSLTRVIVALRWSGSPAIT